MAGDGVTRAIGVILAPHQAEASWGRYQSAVAEARTSIGPAAPQIAYAASWHDHPLFIEAVVDRVRDVVTRIPSAERPLARLLFTAHSIPVAMAERSPYARQFARSAELVAARCDGVPWSIAYQSRSQSAAAPGVASSKGHSQRPSGRGVVPSAALIPRDPRQGASSKSDSHVATQPWLEPDVYDVIRAEARRGTRTIAIVPIGFVCDHLEVLYDLDILAKSVAEEGGVRFLRAATVADHPLFLRMLATLVTASAPSGVWSR